MYLPATHSATIGSNGKITSIVQQDLLNGWADFFNTWNLDPSTLSASVVSQTGGFITAVNAIRVGNVFDSQRRRRDALVELYASAVITP